MQKQVKGIVKLAFCAHVDAMTFRIVESFDHGPISDVHANIKDMFNFVDARSKNFKSSRVVGNEGRPAHSVADEKQIFRDHFCKVLSGFPQSFETLVHDDAFPSDRRFERIDPSIAFDVIPSLSDVVAGFARFKGGKAWGESRICSDIFKRFPFQVGQQIYPLVLKTFTRLQPPLQWKGGVLCELFKGKGDSSSTKAYRDILLANDDGKGIMRMLRSRLLPLANSLVLQSQFGGGLNGGETAFTQLYIRIVCEATKVQQLSCACLFIDVVAAFASMLKRIIFVIGEGDEAWLAKLAAAGFSKSDIDCIYEYVLDHSSMYSHVFDDSDVGKANAFNFSLAEQWYERSWATQDGLPHIIKVNSGSSAGVPLADLLYSLAMARILTNLRDGISGSGVGSEIGVGGGNFVVHEASVVDDVVILVVCNSLGLCRKVSEVCSVVISVFGMFGLDINFSPGKTEVSICLRGPGSKEVRRQIAVGGGSIKVVHKFGSVQLLVVSSYRHVGTNFSSDCRPDLDVALKCGIMRHESSMLNRYLFAQSGIHVSKKIQVMQTYIMSKGLFQSPTWPALSAVAYKRLHTTLVKIYRTICGQCHFSAPDGTDILCSDEFINQYGLVIPLNIVRLNRIMLFCRIVRKDPPGLLDFAVCTSRFAGTWGHTVLGDLVWCCNCEKLQEHRSLGLSGWAELLKNSSPWSRLPRIFRMYLQCPFANISVAWNCDKVVAPVTLNLQCDKCDLKFSSEQSLALHRFKVHGCKNHMRQYVSDTSCPVCLRQFWTRERVVNHIRYRSQVCRTNLLLLGPCLSVEEADHLDEVESGANKSLQHKGQRRHHASIPVVRLQGPLRTVFSLPGSHSNHHALGVGHNYV